MQNQKKIIALSLEQTNQLRTESYIQSYLLSLFIVLILMDRFSRHVQESKFSIHYSKLSTQQTVILYHFALMSVDDKVFQNTDSQTLYSLCVAVWWLRPGPRA